MNRKEKLHLEDIKKKRAILSKEAIKAGLDQFPVTGLRRIQKHIDQGLPVLMDGSISTLKGKI